MLLAVIDVLRGCCWCLDDSALLVWIQAMLFGLFTMCMVCDQWEVVSTNQTQIDRLKGETHSQPSLEIK